MKKTCSQDYYQQRLKLAEVYRKKYPTFYSQPMDIDYVKWHNLYYDYFSEFKDDFKGKHLDNQIRIMGRLSSVRSQGKLGFLTLFFLLKTHIKV